MKYCSGCGKKNSEEAKFCGKCGNKIGNIKSIDKTEKRKKNPFVLVVKTAIILICLWVGYNWLQGDVTFLQSLMVFIGLGLTFGFFHGKSEWFTLAFRWGIFMFVINLLGFFLDFNSVYSLDFWDFSDMIVWGADLLVLYKYRSNQM